MLRKKAILLIHGFAGGAYDYGNLPNDLEFVNNYKPVKKNDFLFYFVNI